MRKMVGHTSPLMRRPAAKSIPALLLLSRITMHRILVSLTVLVIAFPSFAAAQGLPEPWADAEDRPARVDITASLGVMAATDWSDLVLLGSLSPATGVLEQVLVRDVRVDPGTQVDAAITYWRGRYGFRVQVGRAESSLSVGGAPTQVESSAIDMDTWSYDARGVIGLIDYAPRRWVWPYAFFGLGGITYDLERTISPSLLTFIERSRTAASGTIVIADQPRDFLLAVDELGTETVFALSVGVGTDLRIPLGAAGVGLRVELSDQIAPSPVGLRIGELRRSRPLTADTGVHFGAVHHFRASAGFVLHLGR